MWLTFGITWVIVAAWFSKMIAQKRFFIQKTPLDIPIALFLLAHIISTILSIDQHISFWGYYSRFNGGLYSILTYIFLYYAFVSNFLSEHEEKIHPVVKRSLWVSIIAGAIVALWGFPSHFGYDPTCLIFRGTFDVSCWTEAFQPKVRIFSTLGQPNWMAAYLAILLPLTLAFGITQLTALFKPKEKSYELRIMNYGKNNTIILASLFLLLTSLFYIDILYTRSQSGFFGTVVAVAVFMLFYCWIEKVKGNIKNALKIIVSIVAIFAVLTFFIGQPIAQLDRFTFLEIQKNLMSKQVAMNTSQKKPVPQSGTALEGGTGGTNSGTIRQNVWQGALDAWKANPLFGTGVETFAFAYYTYRPAAHNMTSEWDYLYNKAHNEYLNYLATTGIFGLGSYLLMIGVFLWITTKYLLQKQMENGKWQMVNLALLAGYISLLVSNFFGFSVVILNIYLFMIPAFVFIAGNFLIPGKSLFSSFTKTSSETMIKKSIEINAPQWIGIGIIWCIALFQIWILLQFWYADQAFALAQNYNRIGQYNEGAKKIREAITLRGDEPTFAEELATSNANIALALVNQKQNDVASQFANEAIQTSTQLTTDYQNNINFLKSQVRVYYTLSQLDPAYLKNALTTMQRIQLLAPTDAKVAYNLGVLYGQNGQTQKGIDILEQTIKLKPDYRDAYFALGLFYRDLAVEPKTNNVIKPEMQEKAVAQMNYILEHFGKKDQAVLDTLKSWE